MPNRIVKILIPGNPHSSENEGAIETRIHIDTPHNAEKRNL